MGAEPDDILALARQLTLIADALVPRLPTDSAAAMVRRLIAARSKRHEILGPGYFADPSWDIILDLYAARLEGVRIATSSACLAAGVPQTTALRKIDRLIREGHLIRSSDKSDGRRRYVTLSDALAERVGDYLRTVYGISA